MSWSQIQRGNWYFWVGRWWGKSKVYFLKNILRTWQFTSNRSPEHTSSISYSGVTQIQHFEIFFFLLCLEVGWGRREREDPKILRGFFRICWFHRLRKKSFPLQKVLFSAFFWQLPFTWRKTCHKRQAFKQSCGAMETRWGDGQGWPPWEIAFWVFWPLRWVVLDHLTFLNLNVFSLCLVNFLKT